MYSQLHRHTIAPLPPTTYKGYSPHLWSLMESDYRMTHIICDKACNCVDYNTGLQT